MKVIDEKSIVSILKERPVNANKTTCGRVIHVTGSKMYRGACCIAALASMKSGAGMVYVYSDKEVLDTVSHHILETILIERRQNIDFSVFDHKDAILLGSGLGLDEVSVTMVKDILKTIRKPIVIDGDALTILSRHLSLFDQEKQWVLTPHDGEFKRLCPEYQYENRMIQAKQFAKKNRCILVLKGPGTLVTDGNVIYENTTGNPAMASAGMGDALAGLITSYIGQGYTMLESCLMGVYIHGLCGDLLAQDQYVVLANELIQYIPGCMKTLCRKKDKYLNNHIKVNF